MSKPLVSVIIPIYNVAQYLHQCVDSVLTQTYDHLEIILVDDGSPDNCPRICDDYLEKDNRIRVIHKNNGGISDARNAGIKISQGAYLFFLDADDYLAPQCIECLVNASISGVLAISGYVLDFSDKGYIKEPEQVWGEYKSLIDYLNDFHKLFATKFNFVWGKLYRTEIIRRNNLKFSTGVSLAEDLIFNLDYYRYCKNGLIALPYSGYYYRQCGNTTLSKKFDNKMFEWNELCYTKVRDYLKEFGCFTDTNRKHLYCNIVGNYEYGFYLIANNTTMSCNEKVSMIRKYISTPIYQESLSVKRAKRIDYRIFQYLLRHGMIRLYILMERIKRKFAHGLN